MQQKSVWISTTTEVPPPFVLRERLLGNKGPSSKIPGTIFTSPRRLDIDHFVPLAEVHRSGGASWAHKLRVEYANDISNPKTLIAVSASAN